MTFFEDLLLVGAQEAMASERTWQQYAAASAFIKEYATRRHVVVLVAQHRHESLVRRHYVAGCKSA